MLTEGQIKEIEKLIGAKDLQGAIDSPDVVEIEITKPISFSKQAYDELYNDLTTKAYDNGMYNSAKQKGEEIAIKKAKQELGIEFEGKTIKHLLEYIKEQNRLAKDGTKEEINAEHQKEIEQLRKVIDGLEKEKQQMHLESKNRSISTQIDNYFNSLNLDVPATIKDENEAKKFVDVEKDRHKTYFKSLYNFDLDEYGNIISSKDGQLLKDEKLQPVHIDTLLEDYTKTNFVNRKQDFKGRGEGDRLPGNGISNIKTMNDLQAYAEKKGVRRNTSEYDALVIEFNKQLKDG